MTRLDIPRYKVIRIRTLYVGMVGIPDKQAREALNNGQDLLFVKGEEQMTILNPDMGRKVVGRSKETFRDRYRGQNYHLVYYKWEPDDNLQDKLV